MHPKAAILQLLTSISRDAALIIQAKIAHQVFVLVHLFQPAQISSMQQVLLDLFVKVPYGFLWNASSAGTNPIARNV